MSESLVRTSRHGATLVLTIDREDSGNALSLPAARELMQRHADADKDPSLRAVVITGAGTRFFCAGGDLKACQAIADRVELEMTFGTVRRLLDQFEASRLLVIAAINGYALGGGLELALACDVRIASAHAVLGMPQSRLGLIPGWNGTERLVEVVGRAKAMRILLKGERLSAATARDLGLVDEVAEQDCVSTALAYVDAVADAGPLAVAACKRVVLACLRLPHDQARDVTADTFADLWFSADHREAERAFMEKRKPRFGHVA